MGTVKHANINNSLPVVHELLQEVVTSFGTTVAVIGRFMKSAHLLYDVDNDKIKEIIHQLCALEEDDGTSYPALHAIKAFFQPIRHVQTQLEASLTSTSSIVLPVMVILQKQLGFFSSGLLRKRNLLSQE